MPGEAPSQMIETLRRALTGRYEVDRMLGQGGMGSVFLGRDIVLDRPVAIKVVAPELAGAEAIRERFLQEARLVARLRHPNIVAVYAAGEADGLLYFVMELVEGESLRDRLTRDTRMDGDAGTIVLRDLARALAYAHQHGVVHRDVKPENILLDSTTGTALLVDFGVARALAGGDARVTMTGYTLGSPKYMSPEQASGERDLDGRSDVYSLGLVGYEMLSGAAAVSATTPGAAIVAQITQVPTPLEPGDGASPELIAVIERAIEKTPDARWPSAAAFADALDAVLGGRAVGAPPTMSAIAKAQTATRKRRRMGCTAVAVAAALAVAVVSWAALAGGGVPAGVDPRKSFLVAPFEVTGSKADEIAWLREGSVSMLSLNLSQWNDIAVVDYERSLDLLREADLEAERRIALADAREMAREAKMWTVVMGRVVGTPDSLLVHASLYDVASGRKLDEAQRSISRAADPRPAFDALARDLLDLVGAPPNVAIQALAQTTTSSVDAYRAYLEGSRALNAWQLARADSLFASAIKEDSTFALAYYKRALTLGWYNVGDPQQATLVQRAIDHGGRLPQRQRDMFAAYRDLTGALSAERTQDTAKMNVMFTSAQQRYSELTRTDSGDADAWYGLADALWHHRPDGWQQPRTVKNWDASLKAFNRTLALDSTFHLVYSHKLDLYRQASNAGAQFIMDGDSLLYVGDDRARAAFGLDRVAAARARARQLAIAEAKAWSRTDPVPQAYLILVSMHMEADQFDSALVVLEEAFRRPGGRAPRLVYIHAAITAWRGGPEGLAAVRAALDSVPAKALAAGGMTGDLPEILVLAGNTAAYGGGLEEVDRVANLIGETIDHVPGAQLTGEIVGDWWAQAARIAVGIPFTQVKPKFDSLMALIERETPGAQANFVRPQLATPLYLAYLASRDERYAETARKWSPSMFARMREIDALRALTKGDTATARAFADSFPQPDTLRAKTGGITVQLWVARAQVFEELGDLRRAITAYEHIQPRHISQMGRVDVAFPLYARTLLARGRVYEELGEREKAAESYREFLETWRDADPALEPQKQQARDGLARLGDAPVSR